MAPPDIETRRARLQTGVDTLADALRDTKRTSVAFEHVVVQLGAAVGGKRTLRALPRPYATHRDVADDLEALAAELELRSFGACAKPNVAGISATTEHRDVSA